MKPAKSTEAPKLVKVSPEALALIKYGAGVLETTQQDFVGIATATFYIKHEAEFRERVEEFKDLATSMLTKPS